MVGSSSEEAVEAVEAVGGAEPSGTASVTSSSGVSTTSTVRSSAPAGLATTSTVSSAEITIAVLGSSPEGRTAGAGDWAAISAAKPDRLAATVVCSGGRDSTVVFCSAPVGSRSTAVGSAPARAEPGGAPITWVCSTATGVPATAAAPRARPITPMIGRTGGSYFAHRRALSAVAISGTASSAARP